MLLEASTRRKGKSGFIVTPRIRNIRLSRDGNIGHFRNQLRLVAGIEGRGEKAHCRWVARFGIVETKLERNTLFHYCAAYHGYVRLTI